MTSYFVKYHYYFGSDYTDKYKDTAIIDFSDGEIINSETIEEKVKKKAFTSKTIHFDEIVKL